jgi:hypothetical protein
MMVSPEEAFEVVLEITCILDELGVRYLVGGSLASSLWGIPRSTQDADLVADLKVEHVEPFTTRLSSSFYLSPERIQSAVQRRSSFNLIHLRTSLKVDLFMLKGDLLSLQEMTRRHALPVPGTLDVRLQVASPEDTVLQKLLWYKEGNSISDQQWSDILGVLKVRRASLDFAYLEEWADRKGIPDLLGRALQDAGIEPFPER